MDEKVLYELQVWRPGKSGGKWFFARFIGSDAGEAEAELARMRGMADNEVRYQVVRQTEEVMAW
jgi:hypothetical protein